MPLPPLKIPDEGHTYCNDLLGQRVCTGAKHGLPKYLPAEPNEPLKMRLVQVRLSLDGYASCGAYFGRCEGLQLYHAESTEETFLSQETWWTGSDPPHRRTVRMFLKAADRKAAKARILETLPNASFYR